MKSLPITAAAYLFLFSSNADAWRLFGSGQSPRQSRAWRVPLARVRGGDQDAVLTLDEKIQRAMQKLGISPPTTTTTEADCKDGVCPMVAPTEEPPAQSTAQAIADRISRDMNVDSRLVWAALGATSTEENSVRKYDEAKARNVIQQELDMIHTVPEESAEVQQLLKEGYTNAFLVRRALAFSDKNLDDARAILLADQLDEEEDDSATKQQQSSPQPEPEPAMKTVTVDANFDPTSIGMKPPPPPTKNNNLPPRAKKEDVVFEATTSQIQKLVFESPVPVVLDIHAEWCGPCKVLGPALEDMAVKAGGMFRLVKVNSDNERQVSAALGITALPTVFGVRDGTIRRMFRGMPESEDAMRNFLMGLLVPGARFDPPVTPDEDKNYKELSSKLAKMAAAASFSFAAREALQDRISNKLEELVKAQNGDLVDTEESVQVLRSLISNIIRDPFEPKFRTVNLANKVLAAKIAKFPPCIAILKCVGFTQEDSNTLAIGGGKQVVNVAPLSVAREHLDKWLDKTRYDVAKASRKRKDELALKELEESGVLKDVGEEEEEGDDKEEGEVDPNQCHLKVRIAGKNKVHELSLQSDDSLSKILESVPQLSEQDEEMTITCVAKRLVVKSTNKAAMKKTLGDYKLLPRAAVVVTVGSGSSDPPGSSSLAERAAAEKKKKKGSHTMQSIGVYSKDDNAKGELIDGGGGTLWEQDVTDDEEETAETPVNENGESGVPVAEEDEATVDPEE